MRTFGTKADAATDFDSGPHADFISYAREQKDLVEQLVEAFRARGKSVWIGWKDIPPAADWRAEVRAAIEERP